MQHPRANCTVVTGVYRGGSLEVAKGSVKNVDDAEA